MIGVVLLIPFGIGMIAYTLSSTAQSSNSTRLMLTQIAMQVFETSPIFGGGAGTFLERVGSTQVFLIEYGDPLDSHGFIQKIAAETGAPWITRASPSSVFLHFDTCTSDFVRCRTVLRAIRFFFLAVASVGSFIYQLFNHRLLDRNSLAPAWIAPCGAWFCPNPSTRLNRPRMLFWRSETIAAVSCSNRISP